MRGIAPTHRDLNLNLEELVLQDNLLAGEGLDAEEEESETSPEHYRVVTCCGSCHSPVRLCVAAASSAHLKVFEGLLLEGLWIVCLRCSQRDRHGRQ
ncbi:E7 [Canine papillomavirus 23]|nr:E7 [Canine papillomavirus 23]